MSSLPVELKAESVSKNPFFQVLRQTYSELYCLAAKRGWKICVPHSTSIRGATLNEHFFKSHILQSSPYFKEEFVTLNGQCVIYKNGTISTKTGFHLPRKVYVLNDELFYTDDFQSFTVYSISSPLVGLYDDGGGGGGGDHHLFFDSHAHSPSQSQSQSQSESQTQPQPQPQPHCAPHKIMQIAIERRSESDCKQLLALSLEPLIYERVMEEIKQFSDQFNRSYVMIKGYTQAASKRIEEFRNHTFEQVVLKANASKHENSKHRAKQKQKQKAKAKAKRYQFNKSELDELKSAFDSYLSFILFDRIFNTFLLRHFKSEDERFTNKLLYLEPLSQHTIGIKKQFESRSNFKCAVERLATLNHLQCPLHKLAVLQATFKLIRDEIECQHTETATASKHEEMALTTDDMLALFTFVLIHSKLQHILSNNEYIKHFYFPLHCTAHLDYFAATLQASVLYIKDQLFKQLQKQHKQLGICN
eukprot:CAMPEP_0197026408 /NCGR_PEP_ID=MMETSP1384-20130603/6498_1 /TAXON_ID=29189 /ORGANISM="Ammonia sp." /LENGTH=474 /DNA_ID=CAMNT_0042455063 /DNA_START=14 /DNA_END=1438 /DNA_ORIENTATION=-